MAVTVKVELEKDMEVATTVEKAFAQLVNVESTVALFPKIDQLVKVSDDVFRWEMEKIGAAGVSHQVKYTVKYSNNGTDQIQWNPTAGEGNAEVSGGWKIKDIGGGKVKIAFNSQGQFDMPLPGLMKGVVTGIVKAEFDGQVNTFLKRVKEKLENA